MAFWTAGWARFPKWPPCSNTVNWSSGKVVLSQAKSPPALLLTDVVLPGGVNGSEVAEVLCQRYQGLKVLYMSGYTKDFVVHNGRLDEGIDFLEKPFTPETLLQKVRLVLGVRPPAICEACGLFSSRLVCLPARKCCKELPSRSPVGAGPVERSRSSPEVARTRCDSRARSRIRVFAPSSADSTR